MCMWSNTMPRYRTTSESSLLVACHDSRCAMVQTRTRNRPSCIPACLSCLSMVTVTQQSSYYQPLWVSPPWACGGTRWVIPILSVAHHFLDFMMQGEDNGGRCTDGHLDATPSVLPAPSSPIFMPDALPVATLPIHPGLGQALSNAGLHTWRLGYLVLATSSR